MSFGYRGVVRPVTCAVTLASYLGIINTYPSLALARLTGWSLEPSRKPQ